MAHFVKGFLEIHKAHVKLLPSSTGLLGEDPETAQVVMSVA